MRRARALSPSAKVFRSAPALKNLSGGERIGRRVVQGDDGDVSVDLAFDHFALPDPLR
jgi:hypothetical protein